MATVLPFHLLSILPMWVAHLCRRTLKNHQKVLRGNQQVHVAKPNGGCVHLQALLRSEAERRLRWLQPVNWTEVTHRAEGGPWTGQREDRGQARGRTVGGAERGP